MNPFERLHPALQHHIVNSLEWRSLRPLQQAAIGPILGGENVLLLAPTAGGKTEAAFFPVLSEILRHDLGAVSVLYVCPLRALLNNLEQRLSWYCGMVGRSARLWHGDVTQADKARTLREPPDVLLTTPESIEAMLISTRVNKAAIFGRVRFVICDELHAFAADDRGWHLRSVLARAAPSAQRIGLSATVGDPEGLLSWFAPEPRRVVAPIAAGPLDAEVAIDYVGSVENAATVITQLHRGEKRLVFADSRSQAEQLASHLLARGVETFVSHSSLSRDERRRAETAFTEEKNCVIVATSTLELGIDVGDLDRVIQLDAPSTVASFLQRLGRTGRRMGSLRNCLFLTTHRESLLRAAAIEQLWRDGWVEPVLPPKYPVHVTAQQILVRLLEARSLTQAKLLAGVADLPDADRVLAHMRASGFVSNDGPLLMIGPETERLWAGRNYMELLSVFDTPELFAVRHGPADLGYVHELSLRTRDGRPAVVLLAGRPWRVCSVDWKRHLVDVETAEEHGRSTWLGSSRPFGFELCQAMRKVLGNDKTNPRFTQRATKEMASFCMEPLVDREGTMLLETSQGCEWWTFGGMRANAALTYAWPFAVTFDNLSIRARVSPIELSEAINAAWDLLPPESNPRNAPKFAECLPNDLLGLFAWERDYDRRSAETISELPVVRAAG
ncbi:MAG: DEAD/DEAH box helicase [Bryobacteraceae bacterium]|nr:DEAD/DEAH box helicase [Bryobacteraceae bacterium]